MAQDDAPPVDTLEWGNPPAGPDMLTPSELLPVPDPAPAGPVTGPARVNLVALGIALVGFVIAAVAQYLPWLSYKPTTGILGQDEATTGRQLATSIELPLADLNSPQAMVYSVSVVLVLAALGVVLAVGPAVRRTAAAVTFGLLAGNVLILIGLKRSLDHPAVSLGGGNPLFNDDSFSVGLGFTLAGVAAFVLAAAVVVAVVGRLPERFLRRNKSIAVQPEGDDPIDLTVTAVPGSALR